MSAEKRPVAAAIVGDPAGIGPGITMATVMDKSMYDEYKPFLIGSVPIIGRVMKIMGCDFAIHEIAHPQEARFNQGTLDAPGTGDCGCDSIEWGKVQGLTGQMSLDYVMKSIELGRAGLIDVVSTTPIRKEAIKLAGCKLPGRIEIYQVGAQSNYGLTMLHVHNLCIFFVSCHMALRAACGYADKARVLACVQQIHHESIALDINNPRIAAAALNPHGFDNGLFGHEETDNLIPTIKAAQETGINAIGPAPADSMFHLGKQGRYDAILSLYHDQGYITCRTLDFGRSTTTTFGLPFIRGSVDHGMVFDTAGTGKAGTASMLKSTLVTTRCWKMKHR